MDLKTLEKIPETTYHSWKTCILKELFIAKKQIFTNFQDFSFHIHHASHGYKHIHKEQTISF